MAVAADAMGNVGNTDDLRRDGYIGGSGTSYAGKGWEGIFGFFDGIRGVSDRIAGLTGDIADVSENLSAAERYRWELDRDQDAFDQQQQLQILRTERGDNVQLYWVFGAAALAVVVVLAR